MISVIIPVFNAEKYVADAVASALRQCEVSEVILIEDGSSDDSLTVCQALAQKNSKVVLHRHLNGENRGPGETRNLGIGKASGRYVSLLDADDFFLEERFKYDFPLLESDPTLDGAYSVIGVKYEDDVSKKKHVERMKEVKKNISAPKLPVDCTGMEECVTPDRLFLHLLKSDLGWIHLNGLLLRRSSLFELELFNRSYLGQDSEFITRLSCIKRLVCSEDFTPVAVRRVHQANRILAQNQQHLRKPVSFNHWLSLAKKTGDVRVAVFCLLRLHDGRTKFVKALKLLNWFIRNPRVFL